jgi:hypothetical protein
LIPHRDKAGSVTFTFMFTRSAALLVTRSAPLVVARGPQQIRCFSIISSNTANKDQVEVHRQIGIDAESPDALALNYMPDSERPASPFKVTPRSDGTARKRGKRSGRKSGMQLEILKLYRALLQASKAKDGPGSTETYDAARMEFRRQVLFLLLIILK